VPFGPKSTKGMPLAPLGKQKFLDGFVPLGERMGSKLTLSPLLRLSRDRKAPQPVSWIYYDGYFLFYKLALVSRAIPDKDLRALSRSNSKNKILKKL
jgi:hypothetical protein